MITLRRDIEILQGSTFYQDVWFLSASNAAIDMSTYTASMQIRADYGDNAELLVDATTENGMLEFHADGDQGKLTILIPSSISELIPVEGSVRQAVYDLEIKSASDETTRIYSGYCDIRKNITI